MIYQKPLKHTNNFIVLAAFFLIFQMFAVFNQNVFLINSWLLKLLSFVFFPIVFFLNLSASNKNNKLLAFNAFIISLLLFFANKIDSFSTIILVIPLILMLISELVYYFSKNEKSKDYRMLKHYQYLALLTFLIHLIF